ncbi:MAG: cyclase family protein [Acidimicrobiales bacterium]
MIDEDDVEELARSVNNWGRWGEDDEIGTLNLITPDVRRRGAACVRTGRAFPLGIPLSQAEGIQLGFVPGRINPLRTMVAINEPVGAWGMRTSDDVVAMGLQAGTPRDVLAHVSWKGTLYNGFRADTVTAHGATRLGIHRVGAVVGRGVLLDVARALGLPRLEPGYRITAADLDAAEELAGAVVGSGDIAVVRTGQMAFLREGDLVGYSYPSPGLTTMTVPWLRGRDVAAVAIDTMVFEVYPWENEAIEMPVHRLHLVEMGLTQGQNWRLDALADDCAQDGVYEFLLDATPLPFTNATGSPVNPVAVK